MIRMISKSVELYSPSQENNLKELTPEETLELQFFGFCLDGDWELEEISKFKPYLVQRFLKERGLLYI